MDKERWVDRKLMYYGKKIPGLSAYANFWVILITVLAIWGLVTTDFASLSIEQGCLKFVYPSIALLAAVTIHFYDKAAFYTNLLFLAYITVMYTADTISVFLSMFGLTNSIAKAVSDVAGDNPAITAGVSAGSALVTGSSIMAGFIVLTPILIFVIYYFAMLIHHRKFFTSSLKELKQEYEAM